VELGGLGGEGLVGWEGARRRADATTGSVAVVPSCSLPACHLRTATGPGRDDGSTGPPTAGTDQLTTQG